MQDKLTNERDQRAKWINKAVAITLHKGDTIYSYNRHLKSGKPVRAWIQSEAVTNPQKPNKFRIRARVTTGDRDKILINEVTGHEWSAEPTEWRSTRYCAPDPSQVPGFIGIKYDKIYFHRDGEVYQTHKDTPLAVDGYLYGRWECTVKHWNHFAPSTHGLPPVTDWTDAPLETEEPKQYKKVKHEEL